MSSVTHDNFNATPPFRGGDLSPDTIVVVQSTKEGTDEKETTSLPPPQQQQQQQQPPPPPDGGLEAWLQVLGGFFLFCNSWGIVNAFGVYQTYYEKNLFAYESSSNIAWIGSVQAFLLLVVGVLTGPLFDKGYFRHLCFVGSFLVVFGIMMTSIVTQYWQAVLAQGVCIGLGSGCLFIPSVAIVATYFDKKRIFAVGLTASGSSIGGVLYPIIFYRLVYRIGFGWATRVIGFIVLATLVVPCVVMKPRLKASKARKLLLPRVFLEAPMTLFTLGMFFGLMALYAPIFFITPYAQSQADTDEELSVYLLPVLNAASTAGRILPGYIADLFNTGPLNIFVPCTAACSILAFAWIAIHNEPGIIVFSIIYGFFSGTFVSLPPSAVASLSPDLSEVGTRMGMCFFFGGLGVLIGTPIAGALIKGADDYLGTQIFCGVIAALAAALMLGARLAKTGFVVRAIA